MARTGRPRSFDREKAVTAAMHLFWQHGYEGTSLEELRHAMGDISSASLYSAFGSKEALYREAVSEYLRTHGQVMTVLHDASLPPRDRIARALRGSATMQTAVTHPTGCMVALSATVCSEAGLSIQAITASERRANRDAILACVEEGIRVGELRPQTDAQGLAALFEGLLVGLSIQARDGISGQVIDAAITQALKAWDENSLETRVSA